MNIFIMQEKSNIKNRDSFGTFPDWAKIHQFKWHSNPASKHFSKTVFDKSFIRPQTDKAWKLLNESKIDEQKIRKQAFNIIDKYSYDSAPMCLGRTVQTICDARLLPLDELQRIYQTKDRKEIEDTARHEMDVYQPYAYATNDELKAKACFEALDDTVHHAMQGLEHAFQLLGLNQWEGETDVFMELHGIELPYYFKPDFCNLIELKIRSPRLNPPRKDGSRTWSKGSIPKTPYAGWLNQVSAYNSYFNRQPVIVCANNVENKVYHPENGDWMLEQDHLNNTMQNIVQDLKRHEHILRKSDNLEELVQMVIPDWDHISWSSMNPEVLDEAKLLFGVI
tara:strand:+ start:5665 stop:6675 length:1011 start_codon:yes stop_codon:yes gene_type:complete